jgi:endonuclease YncB( thermonuclease family)
MTLYGNSLSESDLWVVPARVVTVVDGDTIDAVGDLGFFVSKEFRMRLLGVDTSETYGVEKGSEEYAEGIEHKQFTADWLDASDADREYPLELIVTKEKGTYGRWIGDVRRLSDDRSLVADLIDEFGTAVEYRG